MKKISLLLIIPLLFLVTSCTNSNYSIQNESTSGNTESTSVACTHIWKSATCIDPKTCTKCNQTQGTALGHTTTTGVCSRCGENFSAWEFGEYTDEFNQPTGEKYILVDSYGTFSNSATTNSKLYAALQIDKDDVKIMMWEYGNHLVKGTFDYENYEITILDQNNKKHSFVGTIYKGGSRIYFKDNDKSRVLNLLRDNATLKIYLKSTKYSVSTYLFSIDTNGFSAAYNSIK